MSWDRLFIQKFRNYQLLMPKNKITKEKTLDEIRKSVSASGTAFDSRYVLMQADKEMGGNEGAKEFDSESNYYKAMTLFEFDKGVLLMNALHGLHRVFALEFSKNLQTEYNCQTPSEKALAETVALNFSRVLDTQRRINMFIEKNSLSEIGLGYLKYLSIESDRAQRNYLASLEALRTLHNPAFEVNIKANTAVVGQNQAVQVKNT